jgi:hypothetical protein
MYSNIKSCVSITSSFSLFFQSDCGVRQGENLSPILFSIYLNDLQSYLEKSNEGLLLQHPYPDADMYIKIFLLLYADDTIILSDDPVKFQKLIDDFYRFCET